MKLKYVIGSLVLVLGTAGCLWFFNNPAGADEYDAKIRALQAGMAEFQRKADELNSRAVTLQGAIEKINNEKGAIQAQIDLNQAQHDKLVIDIAEKEKEIKDNQDALGDTIADLYVDDNISTVEMLFSSSGVGDFINKQEYRNSIRDELGRTIKSVKQLRQELTEKKDEISKVLEDQRQARDNLVAKEAEQNTLLSQTRSDEAAYQKMVEANRDKIAEARALQAAIREQINNTGGSVLVGVGNSGGYPWNNSTCPMLGYLSTGGVVNANGTRTGLDGYGYGCRQCASYAAWRVNKETGRYPTNWGDATNFPSRARANGYSTGSQPRKDSLGVMHAAKAGQRHGHVVWVESDPYVSTSYPLAGRTVILVSQYNYDFGQGYGLYSKMELSVNAFDEYIYIK